MQLHRRPLVVVADNHPLVLSTAAAILAARFDVLAVTSGREAVQAAHRFDADFAVLDVSMRGMGGLETASVLRTSGSRARVVFISSDTRDDVVLAGLAAGASAFVAKTRMHMDLVAALDHVQMDRSVVPVASVLPRWPRPPGHSHDLQLHETEAALVEAVAGYFLSACLVGDALVAVATESHLTDLTAQLKARGIDLMQMAAEGRYVPVDSHAALEAVVVSGRVDRERFFALFGPIIENASAAGTTRHVTAFGEMVPLLCRAGKMDAALELEAIVNDFAVSRPLSVLCPYDLGRSARNERGGTAADEHDLFEHICAAHQTIVSSELHP